MEKEIKWIGKYFQVLKKRLEGGTKGWEICRNSNQTTYFRTRTVTENINKNKND